MSPKILRRCTTCGNFHASYLVNDPVHGKQHLCYKCWKAKQTLQAQPPSDPGGDTPASAVEVCEEAREERVHIGKKD